MAKNSLIPTIRDLRQAEFANMWMKHGKFGILNLCPRFGKIYTTINILEKLPADMNIMIAYPDLKIKSSWEEDFNQGRAAFWGPKPKQSRPQWLSPSQLARDLIEPPSLMLFAYEREMKIALDEFHAK